MSENDNLQTAAGAVADEAKTPANVDLVSDPTPENKEVDESEREKTRVQKRIDKLISRASKAEARAEMLERMQGGNTDRQDGDSLDRTKFKDDAEWIDARAEKKAQEIAEKRFQELEANKRRDEVLSKRDKMYREAEKLGDFSVDDFNELGITPVMAEAILDSDVGHKIMHHLNSKPDLVEEIAEMTPIRQAKALARLEDKLSQAKEEPKKSGAPAPIKPVSGQQAKGLPSPDNTEDWIAWRNKSTQRG